VFPISLHGTLARMGMKALLVAVSGGLPRQDLATHPLGSVDASRRAAEAVLPGLVGDQLPDGELAEYCYPYDGIYAGTFGGTALVTSQHDELLSWVPPGGGRNAYRVYMQSVVSSASLSYWGADGTFRDFGGSLEDGPFTNIGQPLPFEVPFWAGQFRDPNIAAEYPGGHMPFHPMDLGEEALREFFGFVGEGTPRADDLDAFEIGLHGFELLNTPRQQKTSAKPGGLFSRLRGRR